MTQRVAYVTGGMGGIGTSICQTLSKAGFTVPKVMSLTGTAPKLLSTKLNPTSAPLVFSSTMLASLKMACSAK